LNQRIILDANQEVNKLSLFGSCQYLQLFDVAVLPLTRLFSKMQMFCSLGRLQRSALLKVGF